MPAVGRMPAAGTEVMRWAAACCWPVMGRALTVARTCCCAGRTCRIWAPPGMVWKPVVGIETGCVNLIFFKYRVLVLLTGCHILKIWSKIWIVGLSMEISQ